VRWLSTRLGSLYKPVKYSFQRVLTSPASAKIFPSLSFTTSTLGTDFHVIFLTPLYTSQLLFCFRLSSILLQISSM
jgi:hypothetical protein